MKKITFSAQISAPKHRVWETMLQDTTYREWTKPFNPHGSWYEGTMSQDAIIRFLGPDEKGRIGGMISRVAAFEPEHQITFEHFGQIQQGIDDTTSDAVKGWAGSFERYTFDEVEGKTSLTVELMVPEDFVGYMEETWPKALDALKDLCTK